jgi:hypothetical protein
MLAVSVSSLTIGACAGDLLSVSTRAQSETHFNRLIAYTQQRSTCKMCGGVIQSARWGLCFRSRPCQPTNCLLKQELKALGRLHPPSPFQFARIFAPVGVTTARINIALWHRA